MARGPVQAEAVCKLWGSSWRIQLPGPGKALGAAIGELREVAGCVSWGVGACVSTDGAWRRRVRQHRREPAWRQCVRQCGRQRGGGDLLVRVAAWGMALVPR